MAIRFGQAPKHRPPQPVARVPGTRSASEPPAVTKDPPARTWPGWERNDSSPAGPAARQPNTWACRATPPMPRSAPVVVPARANRGEAGHRQRDERSWHPGRPAGSVRQPARRRRPGAPADRDPSPACARRSAKPRCAPAASLPSYPQHRHGLAALTQAPAPAPGHPGRQSGCRTSPPGSHADQPRGRQQTSPAEVVELVMLPVATTRSRCGDLDSRWPSRKSRYLVTTTLSSSSASAAIRPSVVRLPSGRSVVCSTSCPALIRNRASRTGSWASTRNFTLRRAGPPDDGQRRAHRTPARRGYRHARGRGNRAVRADVRAPEIGGRLREGGQSAHHEDSHGAELAQLFETL